MGEHAEPNEHFKTEHFNEEHYNSEQFKAEHYRVEQLKAGLKICFKCNRFQSL